MEGFKWKKEISAGIMGAVCCCLNSDDFEDYVNPNSSVYRNCTCLSCFVQNLLNVVCANSYYCFVYTNSYYCFIFFGGGGDRGISFLCKSYLFKLLILH